MCLETSKDRKRRTSLDDIHPVLKGALMQFLESVKMQLEHGVSGGSTTEMFIVAR